MALVFIIKEFVGVSSFLLVKWRLRLGSPVRAYRALLDRSLEVNIDSGFVDRLEQISIGGIFKNDEGDANKAFLKPTGFK